MSEWAPKRFWKETTVAELPEGFTVHLDGRSVRTPAKAAFALPTRAMAEAAAAEWEAQAEKVDPNTMPVTRAANSAIDTVTANHPAVCEMLAAYGDTDLLCYRADSPVELVARQNAGWDPVLDWAAGALGARLLPVAGVMHSPQSPEALTALAARIGDFDAFALAGFHDLVTLSGSLILGFAVTENHLAAAEAWALSRLDEDWQAEQWGEDEEAVEQTLLKRQAFLDAAHFFELSIKN